jgi:hypothetical protein
MEKKRIPLEFRQLDTLVDAMNLYYAKSMRRVQRIEEVRSKKYSIDLASQQMLLQYLTRLKVLWERGEWPESL